MSFCRDRIFVTPGTWPLPREKASVKGCVKHVHCDGSREHVLAFHGFENWRGIVAIDTCSERDCIVNHEARQRLRERGFTKWVDGSPLAPLPDTERAG